MNALKKLMAEYNGIFGTIARYTSDSHVMNFLNELKRGIDSADYEIIQYFLNELINWYDDNINQIAGNEFVYNLDSHKRSMRILQEIRKDMKPEDCKNQSFKEKSCNSDRPIIFISHKSSDIKYGNALRKFIIGLGVNNDQLIYTSHPLNKIPLDKNIYDYLRESFDLNLFMIILWSNEYISSPACLNEMGAAWVTQKDYTNIYVPNFDFGNPKYHECAIDTRKMGAILNGNENCKASMIELKNKIQKMFSLDNDEQKTSYLLDEFMKEIEVDENNG